MGGEAFSQILASCKVCRIGACDERGMMIVPMNFGYEMDVDTKLYFHTGMDGRKLRAFRNNPHVCFELDGRGALITNGDGEEACAYSFAIFSAMGSGEITFVEAPAEKQRALELITFHQTGRHLSVPLAKMDRVSVLCLTVGEVTTRKKNC